MITDQHGLLTREWSGSRRSGRVDSTLAMTILLKSKQKNKYWAWSGLQNTVQFCTPWLIGSMCISGSNTVSLNLLVIMIKCNIIICGDIIIMSIVISSVILL